VGLEILKQPVHTSVAIDTRDFENFLVEEKLHVAISVKDFKAIVTHADTLRATVTARYTRPCRPLQLSYDHEGMTCEFTLMTRGEAGDGSATSSSGNVRELSARPSSRPPPPTSTASRTTSMAPPEMNPRLANPPPAQEISQPVVQESAHTLPEPLSASMDPLFVPADDDRQWDEAAFEEDSEDILGWDANTNQVRMYPSARLIRTSLESSADRRLNRRRCGRAWVGPFRT
jgi:cell cycle checkpoint control protein RAD9A